MKKILLLITVFILTFFSVYAQDDEYVLASETVTTTGSQIVIPNDITWTQRFILTEIKELRTQLEATRRELNEDLNTRELATVDRALSYSGNTVNFLWLIITMAMAGFWLVGWKTMKDVRENLNKSFEVEVQKNVRNQQKRLEQFMEKFEQEQLSQSKEIIQTQELMQKKQEWAYYWSQYNREEDPVIKLELLDKVWSVGFEEDALLIIIEKSNIYIDLWLWDKAFESSEKGLELSSENTSLLYVKAQALMMLEKSEETLRVLNNIFVIKPTMKEEIMEDPIFENLRADIEAIVEDNNII